MATRLKPLDLTDFGKLLQESYVYGIDYARNATEADYINRPRRPRTAPSGEKINLEQQRAGMADYIKLAVLDDPLREIGSADSNAPVIEYDTIEFDVTDLCNAIRGQMEDLYAWDKEPDFVAIGAEEFAKLTKTIYRHGFFNFQLPIEAIMHQFDRSMSAKIMGLYFRVCPTIKGCVVIPKR